MLESLDKAAEPETKKEVKAEEPPAQEPVTPPNNPEPEPEPQQPEEQQPETQTPEEQPPVTPGKSDNVSYTVEHWQQNITDDEYTKVENDTQTLSGKIGEKTNAIAKTYTGFTVKAFEQQTLSDNGNMVIKIYYDRKTTTITFNENGGTFWGGVHGPLTRGYKYESLASIALGEVLWPSREGYEFRGWAYDSKATTCDYSQNLNFEITDSTPSAVTLYAIWRPDATANGSLNFISGGDVEIVADGNIYEARPSIAGTYTYEWYLNNEKQTVTENRIDLSQLTAGYYILTVKATNTETGIDYVSNFFQPIVF